MFKEQSFKSSIACYQLAIDIHEKDEKLESPPHLSQHYPMPPLLLSQYNITFRIQVTLGLPHVLDYPSVLLRDSSVFILVGPKGGGDHDNDNT